MWQNRGILTGATFMVALIVALKLAAAHEEPQQDILDNFIYGYDVQAIVDLRYTI